MSQTEAMLHTCKTMAGQHIPEANVISRKESRGEVSGMDLNTDLLAEVFSHLPYKDLFEAMLVSTRWEKTVTEADALWKKVDLVRKWDLGGVVAEGGGSLNPRFCPRC